MERTFRVKDRVRVSKESQPGYPKPISTPAKGNDMPL